MTNNPFIVEAKSESATINVGKTIGTNLKGGEVIELAGDLGVGKTTFTKGLAEGAGSKELASSPSFTLCNEYQAPRFKIFHFDFYRLNDPGIIRREVAEAIGDGGNVIVIEWPAVIGDILPGVRLAIDLSVSSENSRELTIDCPDALRYLVKGLK